MQVELLFEIWQDKILRQYLWDIAGSFAHGDEAKQAALYADAWCKISWCEYPCETEALMDIGFSMMERYARKNGWIVQRQEWHGNYPARVLAKGRIRFFVKRNREKVYSVV